jgi:hypothetical protein
MVIDGEAILVLETPVAGGDKVGFGLALIRVRLMTAGVEARMCNWRPVVTKGR